MNPIILKLKYKITKKTEKIATFAPQNLIQFKV